MKKKDWLVLFCVVSLVILGDQVTKQLIFDRLSHGESLAIIPNYISLTLVFNKGVAFGLFANLSDGIRIFFLAVTHLAALVFVVYLLFNEYQEDWLGKVALGLVIGGAVGNLVDRVNLGMVIDFIDIYYNNYHWPAFNLADSMICIGVIYLIISKPFGDGKNGA